MDLTDAPSPPRRLSRVLVELAEGEGERITLAALAEAVGDRSFAAFMILFSAPNLVPLPPGASTVFGIPLLIVAAQLLYGSPRIWLPKAIANRSVDRGTFGTLATRLVPYLKRFEAIARPRYWPASRVLAERWVGFVAFVMAVVLIMPIPFGNWLPALAVVIISLGLAERDGLWVIAGTLLAVVSLVLVAGIILSIAYVTLQLFFS